MAYLIRFITSAVGVLLGLSAVACFGFTDKFQNFHCAGWGLFSGILAGVVLVMHVFVYRDLSYSIQPVTFKRLQYSGILGMVIGLCAFVGYCVVGLVTGEQKEEGIKVKGGYFLVMVWGYMTWKWGFLLFWYARKYHKILVREKLGLLSVNESNQCQHT